MDSYSLKSVFDLPAPFRSTFTFRYFNSLQSECFSECFHSDTNMVISAPTGSGKTVLFELCILRLLSRFLSQEGKFNHIKGTLKTIYIAPSKALVQEKLRDWNQKLGSWGINCLELTGDSEVYNVRSIQEADLILTTPEKFDAVTRYRIRDGGLSFFSDIGLLLIDEVHLLNDPRGASLEAIVSRIKMLSRNPEMSSSSLACVRFIAVSATIPNTDDLAEWLMAPAQGIKRFGEEMRPVKLTSRVFVTFLAGYAPAKNDFLFERRLQNYVFDILMQHSRGKSALVFCSTRKGAQEAALRLSQTAMTFGHSNPFIKSKEQQERLKDALLSFSDKQMQSCIPLGVFGNIHCNRKQLIFCIFSSNKEKGLYTEYERSMILQMCGRAGRPPFDDTGMVVIMTRRETVHLYENLLSGCEMVESQAHLHSQKSFMWSFSPFNYCSYTYMHNQNPENYGVKRKIPGESLEKHMQEICVQKVNELSRHGMIWMDEYGFLLKPLEPGKLMTKYYLKFDTMKHIMETPESCSLEDALNIICCSEEIAWIQLRRNEKKLLNDINNDKEGRLRFHILTENGKRKKRIQTREEKIFVLANDCLTGDPLCHDLSFSQDMSSICSNGCRIAKCMKEYFIHKKNYKGFLSSTILSKCLYQRIWDDSPYLLKQLTGIGMVTAKALQSAGVNSFETLAEADPRRIEILTGRKYPFGNHIKESLLSLPPKVEMKVKEIECCRQGKSKIVITLTRISQSVSSAKHQFADMVIGSEEDNLILFHEKIRVNEFSSQDTHCMFVIDTKVVSLWCSPYSTEVLVSAPQQGKLTVKADLIFEEHIGLDLHGKLFMERATDAKMNQRRSNLKSSFTHDLPKEIYVLEDDNMNSTSETMTEEHRASNKSKMETSSMPSFNLLDEDLDEVLPYEAEENRCDTITEKTIFDHIRRKAKSFPVLAPSDAMNSSISEISICRGRYPYKSRNELHMVTEVPDSDRDKIHTQTVTISDSEPGDPENHSYGTDEDTVSTYHIKAKSSGIFKEDMMEVGHAAESEESSFSAVTQETVFDHIRKKAKHFPDFTTTKIMELEPLTPTRDCFNKEQSEIPYAVGVHRGIDFSTQRETKVVPDSGHGEVEEHIYRFNNDAKEKHHELFGNSNDRSREQCQSVSATYSNILEVQEVTQPSHKRRPALPLQDVGEYSSKQQRGSNGSNRQLCALDVMGENKEVQSFLGFTSVFSFL
ncbi:hypothetical protein IFM89_014081 [Coptis chinensis]|uniref:Helicase ATP-binding domain-containing protein n=1 Tax=Coptis chinensis TaxID=261450 RepID=A0A835J091_9MAGN|nr:hypothetical protein IFM89_014081 [Coptis chinensis]